MTFSSQAGSSRPNRAYVEIPSPPAHLCRVPSRARADASNVATTPDRAKAVVNGPRSGQVYVLLQRRPKRRSDKDKARDKSRSEAKRAHQLDELLQRDMEEYGAPRRHLKKAAFKILGTIKTHHLRLNLAFDINVKSLRTFPVASTGWTGTRIKHTDEERELHNLDWFLARGFEVRTHDGR